MSAVRERLAFDVSGALDLGDEAVTIAASLHLPSGTPRAVLVCWPGGCYNRSYWEFSDVPGYNFAEHMVEQGFAVVAADPLGVEESSQPADVDAVTLQVMAAAHGDFARQVREHIGLDVPLVGVGHSLGGCLAVMTQALHGSYDRVVSLGYTHGAKDSVTVDASGAGDARAAAVIQAQGFFAGNWDDGYAVAPREPNHAWLYRPSTPADVIAADDLTVAAWPRQAYVEALQTGFTSQFIADVTCPVLLAFGDHDIPEKPHDDVSFYTGSADVCLVILEDAAHCHNFASPRTILWDRIGALAVEPTLIDAKGTA
jgi:pimeloyl-ACP methyl ester carboxylesterase